MKKIHFFTIWGMLLLVAISPAWSDDKREKLPTFDELIAHGKREISRDECQLYWIPLNGKSDEVSFSALDTNQDGKLGHSELKNYVTLKDWQAYSLSKERFLLLDMQKPFGVLTEEELNADPLHRKEVSAAPEATQKKSSKEEDFMPYIFFAVILGSIVAVTMMAPMVLR
jgi:hypothetical protein